MAHENVVVVGVDGTPASQAALEWGFNQAKARGAELRLVCVYELPSYAAHSLALGVPDIVAEGKLLYESAEKMILDLVGKYQNKGVNVTWSLLQGDPSEEMVELSKTVALLVVGGRENWRGRIADRILRTVSSALPAYSHCPTVVVPQDSYRDDLPIRRVVVGVDGSEAAKTALQRAVWEADRHHATLDIVSSVNVDAVSWVPQFSLSKEFFDDVYLGIKNQLAEVDEGRDIKTSITVTQGNPITTLIKFSEDADLLVLGTRGRGGFAGLLLGSTSQSVLEQAKCPVFIVPKRVGRADDEGPKKEA
ncbi:universal stress protein [Arcanobacterium sp. S3PF19]|uniref:universal stress protein n=1 Tax=Arcanobacterium sp. S3PF19 TaxID=1219585 RepID=UPI00050F9518|nr:universal stress protein [Arcanobacterium sp. S3PF19]KGF05828.1 hypothetical protein HMPREF1631_02950 [Arcanobacterium sp. S3PF19]